MKAKTTGLKKIEYKIFKFPQKTILLSIESSRLYKIHTCLIPLFLNKNYFNSWKRIENYLKKLPLKNKTLISQEIKHFIQSENNCFNKKTLQKQSKKIQKQTSALNLVLTNKCNLNCIYCFAGGGDYGCVKTEMDFAKAKKGVDLLLKRKRKDGKCRIEFFGGEPLFNFSLIKKVVRYCKSLEKKGLKFIFRISTNLTYLTSDIIDFFGENNFILSVSIDGSKKIQDFQRPFKTGKGSFAVIFKNLKLIRKKHPHLTIVARITLYQKPILSSIRKLLKENIFDFISIYLAAIDPSKRKMSNFDLYNSRVRKNIIDVCHNYLILKTKKNRFFGFLEMERLAEMMLKGYVPFSHCGAGLHYLTLSPDGVLHPCHRLVGEKKFSLGEIDKVKSYQLKPWDKTVNDKQNCCCCWARYLCGGGCWQEPFLFTNSLTAVSPEFCAFTKDLIKETINNITNYKYYLFSKKPKSSYYNYSDLFVFCGQPIFKNNRQAMDKKLLKGKYLKAYI